MKSAVRFSFPFEICGERGRVVFLLLFTANGYVFELKPLSFYFRLQDSCNKFVVPHDVMKFSEGKITELISLPFQQKNIF